MTGNSVGCSVSGYNGYTDNNQQNIKSNSNHPATRSIFANNNVWKQGEAGRISVYFNNNSGSNISSSQIGSESTKYCTVDNCTDPSMILSTPDPPFGDFYWPPQGTEGSVLYSPDYTGLARSGCESPNQSSSDCDPNWIPGSSVLHEFGHAMAMLHEHQNSVNDNNPLNFIDQNVYDDYYDLYICGCSSSGIFNPNSMNGCYLNEGGCTKEYCEANNINPSLSSSMISNVESNNCPNDISGIKSDIRDIADEQVINQYDCPLGPLCDFSGSDFDEDSLMLYPIPDNWIVGGAQNNPTKLNFEFSAVDKEWLALKYSLNSGNKPNIIVEFINGEDWEKAWVEKVVTEGLIPFAGINFTFTSDHLPLAKSTEEPIALYIGLAVGGFFLIFLILFAVIGIGSTTRSGVN